MGVRVYNDKTGVSITCDAKYWAECSDHGVKAGYVLWNPSMTNSTSNVLASESLASPNDNDSSTVTLDDYYASSADENNDYEYQFGTCSECEEEEVQIYDTDNHTCLDCYSNNHDNETDGDWMDGEALDSVGWGNDESYY